MSVSHASTAVLIRTSLRAKRLRLQLTARGVELVRPGRVSQKAVDDFLAFNEIWIQKATNIKLEQDRLAQQVWPQSYSSGAIFQLSGRPIGLSVVWGTKNQIHWESDRLLLTLPLRAYDLASQTASFKQMDEALALLIEKQFRLALSIKLQEMLSELVPFWHAQMGGSLGGYKIAHAKHRWGSCSSTNIIRIHASLVLAPTDVLTYVIIHELAHLHYRHHRATFWRLVAKHCPAYLDHDRWLRAHAFLLSC